MVLDEVFEDMKRCTKCILPETFPGIRFDDEGTCNYCLNHKKVEVKGEEALKRILSQYGNNGGKYDCIVPISGGRDSAYVLHQIVRKYKMRSLSLTVDSGAIMPEGYRNIETITNALSVDHVWIRDEKQVRTAQNNTRLKFRAWLNKPSINTIVPTLNAGDKTMNLRIYRYASEHRIPLVLGGNNVGNTIFEQEHFKTGFMGIFPDDRGNYSRSARLKLCFLLALQYLRNFCNYYSTVLKEYLRGAYAYFFETTLKPRNVTPIGFYDYIYWREKDVLPTIQKELGWRGASDTTATWRIDDSAYPLIDYLYLKLVGFNEFDEHYSKLIREGQISRGEALRRCLSDNAPRMPSLIKRLDELKVRKEEVEEAIERYRPRLLSRVLKRKHRH